MEMAGVFAQDVRFGDMERNCFSLTASILRLQHSDTLVFESSGGFSSLVK